MPNQTKKQPDPTRREDYWAGYFQRPTPTRRRRERRAALRVCKVFFAALFLLALIGLFLPLRPQFSDLEQRELTKFPKPTVDTFWNGAFFDQVNTWYADTFPFREQFLQLESGITRFYGVQKATVVGDVEEGDAIPDASDSASSTGDLSAESEPTAPAVQESDIPELSGDAKVEKLGAVLIVDDAAYEYYNFSQKAADRYIEMVNKAASLLSGTAHVYDLVVPTSMDICVPESLRKSINTSSQREALDYLHNGMSGDVQKVEVFDTLLQHSLEGEYDYFRTDHHWTADGAYRAYEQFCALAGRDVAAKEKFERVEYDNFRGSFYRETKSAALKKHPDTVVAYIPPSSNTVEVTKRNGNKAEEPVVADVSSWNASSKYSTFIGGDNPFSHIENPNRTDGSAILLIKESFGNAFAPFLVENYQDVYILDYRYFRNVDNRELDGLVSDLGVSDVLFLNNVSAVRNGSAVGMMEQLVGD